MPTAPDTGDNNGHNRYDNVEHDDDCDGDHSVLIAMHWGSVSWEHVDNSDHNCDDDVDHDYDCDGDGDDDNGDNNGYNCEIDVEHDGDDFDEYSVLIEVALAESVLAIKMMTIMAIVCQV